MPERYKYQVGEHIDGRFEVTQHLGKGRFSEVYHVRNKLPKHHIDCVLKLFLPNDNQDGTDLLDLIRKEHEALINLAKHPHIVDVIDISQLSNHDLYLLLEYVPGLTIKSMLDMAKGSPAPPIPVKLVRQAALDLLEALVFMHGHQPPILHRDLKPANLIYSEKRGLVIIDFNVCKILDEGVPAITKVGTLGYMPPEVDGNDGEWTERGDIFAAGVVLYEMLTGKLPYSNSVGNKPEPPATYFPEISSGVARILLRAVEYNPQQRFQTAQGMRQAILDTWPADGGLSAIGEETVEQPSGNDWMGAQEYVQDLINRRLHDAKKFADAGKYPEALKKVDEAREVAAENQELVARVESCKVEIQEKLHSQVEAWVSDAEGLASNTKDFDQGRVEVLLDRALELTPGHEAALVLKDKLPKLADEQREKRLYDETRKECEELWAKEKELLDQHIASDEILFYCFQKALSRIEQVSADHPGYLSLSGLHNEALLKYNQARDRYEVLSTFATEGKFREMLDMIDQQDPKLPVPIKDDKDMHLGTFPVDEARRRVNQMAEAYAHKKVQEYIDNAQEHLDAHAPRAARDQIEKGKTLFQLNDEDKGRLTIFQENKVTPELERLESVESFLAQAKNSTDPQSGWELVEKAVVSYPWAPGILEEQKVLVAKLAEAAEKYANWGRTKLEENNLVESKQDSDLALKMAGEVEGFYFAHPDEAVKSQAEGHTEDKILLKAQSSRILAKQTLVQVQAEQDLRAELAKEADDLEDLLEEKPDEGVSRWEKLVEKYGIGTLNVYAQFRVLQTRVAKISALTAAKVEIDSAFASYDLPTIQRTLQYYDAAEKEGGMKHIDELIGKDADLGKELLALYEKLRLRWSYLQGLDILSSGGNAVRALSLLRRVAGHQPPHPDESSAQLKIDEIEGNVRLEQDIDKALVQARKNIVTDPRMAYQLLEKYKDTISLKHDQVVSVMRQAQQAWQVDAERRAGELLNHKNTDVRSLEVMASELESLPEPRPVSLLNKVYAVSAAKVAKEAHEKGNRGEEIEQWNKAKRYDPRNSEYQKAWRLARIEQTREGLKTAGENEAEGWFNGLLADLLGDQEVCQWRVNYYLTRAESQGVKANEQIQAYSQARQALNQLKEAIENSPSGKWESSNGKVADLERKIDQGEERARSMASIEKRLDLSRSLEDFKEAKKAANQLLLKQELIGLTARHSTEDWWSSTVNQVVSKLESHYDEILSENVGEQFEVCSKISVLDPGHKLAIRLINGLPQTAERIETDIQTLLDDRTGLKTNSINDKQAINVQKFDADRLYRNGQDMYLMLQTTSTQQSSLTGLMAGIRQALTQLGGFITLLGEVQTMLEQATSYLQQGRAEDKWDNFELMLKKIGDKGFGQHRSVNALRNESAQIKQRRQDLCRLRDELIKFAESEQFNDALEIVDRFDDKETGDPQDTMGLKVSIAVKDAFAGKKEIRGWYPLTQWLLLRKQQIDTLENWLLKSGAGDITGKAVRIQDPTGVVEWSKEKSRIVSYAERGRFSQAEDLAVKVYKGKDDAGWFDPEKRILSLSEAVERLRASPVNEDQLLSAKATILLESGRAHWKELTSQANQASKQIAWVREQPKAWEDAEAELDQAIREYHDLKNKKVRPWQKMNHEIELQSALVRVHAAIQACRTICPLHPNLENIEKLIDQP